MLIVARDAFLRIKAPTIRFVNFRNLKCAVAIEVPLGANVHPVPLPLRLGADLYFFTVL